MLGMGLVVAIMALLLGGTLHGLTSYRHAMGTFDSKLEELGKAVKLKEEIQQLYQPNAEPAHQAATLDGRVAYVETALEDYKSKLQETKDRGRLPNDGKLELDY